MTTSNTPLHSAPPKPAAQPIVSRAKQIAYFTGIRELEPLVLRIEQLEREIAELKNK